MKTDMQAIVGRIKVANYGQMQPDDRDFMQQEAIIDKEQRITELGQEVEQLKKERDSLIQISNDLRADLNRS